MKSGDFEATVEDLNLTRRETKELRHLVFHLPSAVAKPPAHLGPLQWAKSLLVVALVLAFGVTLGYGIFLTSRSEWFSRGASILEGFTSIVIVVFAILNWYEAAIRGRIVRKLYHVLQTHKSSGQPAEHHA